MSRICQSTTNIMKALRIVLMLTPLKLFTLLLTVDHPSDLSEITVW